MNEALESGWSLVVRGYWFLIALFLIVPFSADAQNNDDKHVLEFISLENLDDLILLESFDLPDAIDLDWAKDGKRLVISTYEGVWLLELADMQLNRINFGEIVGYDVEFIEGINQIIVGSYSELILYDLDTANVERVTPPSGSFPTISDDGTLYASIEVEWNTDDDTVIAQYVRIYNVPDNTILLEKPVTLYEDFCFYACQISIAFSPDNSQLAFTAAVPEVESAFVNLATGEKRSMPMIGHWGIDYSQDGSLIATTAGRPGYIAASLLLIDTETAEITAQTDLFSSSSPDFSHSGELMVVGAYDDDAPNPDEATGFVYFFHVQNILLSDEFSPIAVLRFARPPTAIEFSPNDQMLAVSDGNGSLSLWGVPADE